MKFLLFLMLFACAPVSVSQSTLLPLLVSLLHTTSGTLNVSAENAAERGDYADCLVSIGLAESLKDGATALSHWQDFADATLPAEDISVAFCAIGETPVGTDVPSYVSMLVEGGLVAARDVLVASSNGLVGDDCKALRWAAAAVDRASGVGVAVIAEIEHPDTHLDIPGVSFSLDTCG